MINYNYLYKKLNKRTPLKTDCGNLCSNACCVDTEGEELGMYLFPGEERMFEGKENFRVEDSDFECNGRKVKILFCKPYCDRNERPLSCRIFPLFPYVIRNKVITVIVDPRSRGVCPLHKRELIDFNSSFVRGVRHISRIIASDSEGCKFLYELSRLIDEEIEELAEMFEL